MGMFSRIKGLGDLHSLITHGSQGIKSSIRPEEKNRGN